MSKPVHKIEKKSLTILSWNVEGLKSKLFSFDLHNTLCTYDIVGLIETWDMDSSYCINYFQDYVLHSCPAKRSLAGGRPMGGIMVGVKNTIAKLVERICEDLKFGVFLKINKSMFTTGRDVIFASVYIPPPEKSPVYDNNNISVLECLENCFTTQDWHKFDIIIGGDLKARIGTLLSIQLVKIQFLNWRSILIY